MDSVWRLTGGAVQEVRAQEAPVFVHGGEGDEGREVVEEAGVALQPLEDCGEKERGRGERDGGRKGEY